MTLSVEEEKRLQLLELKVEELQELFHNAASKRMLNRMVTLCNEANRETRSSVESLEATLEEILTLAQKLQ